MLLYSACERKPFRVKIISVGGGLRLRGWNVVLMTIIESDQVLLQL